MLFDVARSGSLGGVAVVVVRVAVCPPHRPRTNGRWWCSRNVMRWAQRVWRNGGIAGNVMRWAQRVWRNGGIAGFQECDAVAQRVWRNNLVDPTQRNRANRHCVRFRGIHRRRRCKNRWSRSNLYWTSWFELCVPWGQQWDCLLCKPFVKYFLFIRSIFKKEIMYFIPWYHSMYCADEVNNVWRFDYDNQALHPWVRQTCASINVVVTKAVIMNILLCLLMPKKL